MMMQKKNRGSNRVCILVLCLTMVSIFIFPCDAKRSRSMRIQIREPKHSQKYIITATNKLKIIEKINVHPTSNSAPYGVSSPFSLPPYDSLAPLPLAENASLYCNYPPPIPQTPSTTTPTPIGYTPPSPPSSYVSPVQSPPPASTDTTLGPPGSSYSPNPPETIPSPFSYNPGPPGPTLTPPYYEPSPPSSVPSPPSSVPSPYSFVPSPPIFLPPVVFPPPTVPPPPANGGPSGTLWCVAKPSVPDPIIQEAMNYACGSGAECDSIQASGSCFEPNTILAHASYAFNDYWQRTKVAGGTCSFGGIAMLVTIDPSYDGCHFVYY